MLRPDDFKRMWTSYGRTQRKNMEGSDRMAIKNEKIVMRAGIYTFLAYSILLIAFYALLYSTHIGNYIIMLNTGIDVLFFIPIYATIISIVFSYKRIVNYK